jgi:hypothetical protein
MCIALSGTPSKACIIAAISSDNRAFANAPAASSQSDARLGAIRIWSPPRITTSPIVGFPGEVNIGAPGIAKDFQSQPAALRAGDNWSNIISVSSSGWMLMSNGTPENGLSFSIIDRGFFMTLGANLVSNAMICEFCDSIVDCCRELIDSSKTNRKTVHSDSTAMPPSTSHIATRWAADEYLGDSSMIPNPTMNAANILTDNKTTWGQNGAASPERTILKYVSINAILAWLFVALMAIAGFVGSLVAFWRERGKH